MRVQNILLSDPLAGDHVADKTADIDQSKFTLNSGSESSSSSHPIPLSSTLYSSWNESKSLKPRPLLVPLPTNSPSMEDLSSGSAFALSTPNKSQSKSRITAPLQHIIPSIQTSTFNNNHSLAKYDLVSPSSTSSPSTPHHRPFFFHTELQFIMTLTDISDRLRSVPKESRQGSLAAEMALLNHNLPARVCVPLWCPARGHNAKCEGYRRHHSVVRVAPTDAVILNSADRVSL